MNVIEAYEKPEGLEVITHEVADFIPDNQYVTVPTHDNFLIMVNNATYNKIVRMNRREVKDWVQTLREFKGHDQ